MLYEATFLGVDPIFDFLLWGMFKRINQFVFQLKSGGKKVKQLTQM